MTRPAFVMQTIFIRIDLKGGRGNSLKEKSPPPHTLFSSFRFHVCLDIAFETDQTLDTSSQPASQPATQPAIHSSIICLSVCVSIIGSVHIARTELHCQPTYRTYIGLTCLSMCLSACVSASFYACVPACPWDPSILICAHTGSGPLTVTNNPRQHLTP